MIIQNMKRKNFIKVSPALNYVKLIKTTMKNDYTDIKKENMQKKRRKIFYKYFKENNIKSV